MKINCDISVGEYIDKVSILHVKKNKLKDQGKIDDVEKELLSLNDPILNDNQCKDLIKDLYECNLKMWNINELRRKNTSNDKEFIKLCLDEMTTNDQRYLIKNKINRLFNSELIERKSHL